MEKPNYKGLNPAHRQRIIAFEQAVRAHNNMGAQHPADHAAIEENLGYCRDQLVQTILGLYGKSK